MDKSNIKTILLDNSLDFDNLIIKIFSEINISIKNINDLDNLQISRLYFLDNTLHNRLIKYVPNLKKYFKSGMLNSLHDNSSIKQKFPSINFYRQILKCCGFKMKPFIISDGYYKNSGKKKIKRYFLIIYESS